MGEACQVEKDETSEADKVGKGERTKGERVEERVKARMGVKTLLGLGLLDVSSG